MTDDHNQSAMGAYGNTILKTPNLDRIADEALRFDLGFVTNALCLQNRASFLTGQYSHTHGLRTNGDETGFKGEPERVHATAWPHMPRRVGYKTAAGGKWQTTTRTRGQIGGEAGSE